MTEDEENEIFDTAARWSAIVHIVFWICVAAVLIVGMVTGAIG